MLLLLADICNMTAALIVFGFGIVYFYKSKSEKNHCSNVQKNLVQSNEVNRVMLFALMRGVGGGAIAISVVSCWLQFQYSASAQQWMALTIAIVNLLFCIPSLNAMLLVKRKTNINPPVYLLLLVMLLVVVGYFLNIKGI